MAQSRFSEIDPEYDNSTPFRFCIVRGSINSFKYTYQNHHSQVNGISPGLVPKSCEPRREKTGLRGFRPGLTQTDLYSHESRLEA